MEGTFPRNLEKRGVSLDVFLNLPTRVGTIF